MDLGKDVFIMHIAYLEAKMSIYLAQKAQIVLLLVEKNIVLAEYLNYAAVFLKKSVAKLSKQTYINKYLIDPKPSNQLLYKPNYSLKLVKVETFKIYIEIILANTFIYLFKFPIAALILIIQKSNYSFCISIGY